MQPMSLTDARQRPAVAAGVVPGVATGQVVPALPPDSGDPAGSVQGTGLVLVLSPPADLELASGGELTAVDRGGERQQLSHLPAGRMAAPPASWDQIAQALRKAEQGEAGGMDVELAPGGQLVLTDQGKEARPVSRLPQGRMAAANAGPAAVDVAALQALDPGNCEHWTPVLTDLMAGWTFRLTPPFEGQAQFVFFAFRSPSDRNAFRIAVLEPAMDTTFGHVPHMFSVNLGGQRIPVICGPGGQPARTLADVRSHAAKWMAYTSARLAGRNPGFSL